MYLIARGRKLTHLSSAPYLTPTGYATLQFQTFPMWGRYGRGHCWIALELFKNLTRKRLVTVTKLKKNLLFYLK